MLFMFTPRESRKRSSRPSRTAGVMLFLRSRETSGMYQRNDVAKHMTYYSLITLKRSQPTATDVCQDKVGKKVKI